MDQLESVLHDERLPHFLTFTIVFGVISLLTWFAKWRFNLEFKWRGWPARYFFLNIFIGYWVAYLIPDTTIGFILSLSTIIILFYLEAPRFK